MNIILFGAHPDDLEILCGGTIAKYVSQGHRVTMAVATNGNVGSPNLSREKIREVRMQEAKDAATILGAHDFIWLDENDEFLFDNESTRRKFVDAIRRAQAEVVITHNPNDYHPDHVACSKLASDARILSAVRLIESEHSHLQKIPELIFMDSVAGLDFHPQHYVDISDTMELKKQAVRGHKSQDTWIDAIFGYDLEEIVKRQSAFRGLQCGKSHAEGFIIPPTWPRSNAARLLPE
ncbi:MAG: PIG-L family deacetylase [Chthoniobacterales bacterium]